ncbi:MAG: hypothetical protein O2979_07855 [Proteobacteria bacterium]|nr:hypothetical protein [Pseudomonadota bacterium]
MTLENLLRIGKLKAHAADEREMARLLDSASPAVARECAHDARRLLAEVRAWIAARRPPARKPGCVLL